jgi:diguanylate cyclase (GGDEF)-like protein
VTRSPHGRAGRWPHRAHGLLLAAGVGAGAAAAVVLAGGGDAFWICVPGALLLATMSKSALEAALGGSVVVAASAGTTLARSSISPPATSLALAIMVPAASVAILLAARRRTEREREAFRTSSLTDPLTGLANRRALFERIDYEIVRHTRQRRSFAVLMLDLDGFKRVNDRFGHAAGDELLRDVAAALQSVVREQDTVARMGGDEFCVLAPETRADGAQRLAARAEAAVSRITTGLDALGVSAGIALFEADGSDCADLLARADAAQAEAKRRARRAGVRAPRAA